jgi:hypothetical protein
MLPYMAIAYELLFEQMRGKHCYESGMISFWALQTLIPNTGFRTEYHEPYFN